MEQNILYVHTRNSISFSEKKIESNRKRKTNWRRASTTTAEESRTFFSIHRLRSRGGSRCRSRHRRRGRGRSRSWIAKWLWKRSKKYRVFFIHGGAFEKLVTSQPSNGLRSSLAGSEYQITAQPFRCYRRIKIWDSNVGVSEWSLKQNACFSATAEVKVMIWHSNKC